MAQGRNPISEELFAIDPYLGLEPLQRESDLQGWGSTKAIFETLIARVRPRLILEVGSWKGESAINMAALTKKLNLNTTIVCIDTWLGSLEHWNQRHGGPRHHWYTSLQHKHGYPQLYYQFLANVVNSGMSDVIVPFPTTSAMAARWLAAKQIKADLIYIDAGHEEDDVYADVSNYFRLLSDGGVMLGDDWGWKPDVPNAVRKFVRRNYPLAVEVVEQESMFVIQKRRTWRDIAKRLLGRR